MGVENKTLEKSAEEFAIHALANLKSDFVPSFDGKMSDEEIKYYLRLAYVRGAQDRVHSLFKQGMLHLKEAGK